MDFLITWKVWDGYCSNFQVVIITMLNIYSQYIIKFEIRVKNIFYFFLAIVDFDFFLILRQILYKSEIMRCILLKFSEKNYYYVAYRFSMFYQISYFRFFNIVQFLTQIFSTVVFSVRMEIPCTLWSMHAHTHEFAFTQAYVHA